MTLSRYQPGFWSQTALAGAGLLALAACGPGIEPYEPAAPAPEVSDTAPPDLPGPEESEADIPAAGEVPGADPLLDIEHEHSGETHVHGAGDLSVTREDDFLTVTLDAPLANFGLSEATAPQGTKAEKYARGIAEPLGPTDCEQTEQSVTARTDGAHGAMTVSVVWRCKQIDRVEGMQIKVFELYPGFEHIEAIYLGPNGEQVAKELTPGDAELDFD